jgi:Na+-translocating ferredoxin:NAD+ oxidoreductase RnfC subunit
MRSLGFSLTGADNWNQWAELCCACGLCTLYACPEDLFPKEACDQAKQDLRSAGIEFVQKSEVRVHPIKDGRRVPLSMLRKRLRVEEYEGEAPFDDRDFAPKSARILLSQHMGKPAQALVQEGELVERGALIASVGSSELGANIHASVSGRVQTVSESLIEITA